MQSTYLCMAETSTNQNHHWENSKEHPCLLESIRMSQIIIFYTLGSPCEANKVLRRSNGYDPTVAAHPANAPLA